MEVSALHCIICPLQPRFSDLSHLLTHISSKAHLSHYFKLQVRSHQNGEALELLSEYDGWFKNNDLARLLAQRINTKDDRKKRKKSSQVKTAASPTDLGQHLPSSTSQEPGLVDTVFRSSISFPHFLDPRLADSFENVKKNLEGEDASFSCQVAPTPPVTAPIGGRVVHANTTTRITRSQNKTKLEGRFEGDASALGTIGKVTFPVTPTPRRRSVKQPSDVTWNTANGQMDPFIDYKAPTKAWEDVDAEKERADEMARLKGVLWPGMDVFDSATRQMRRKRNQRKDDRVLKMMEVTSSLVEPAELIFSSEGDFLKQREITGNIDEDSPLKGETPVPRTRISRPRQYRTRRAALAQIDLNVRRGRNNKRAKRTAKYDRSGSERSSSEEEDDQNRPASFRRHNPFGTDRSDFEDGDDDLSLTVRAFAKRPRAGFTIFAHEDDHASRLQSLQSKYTRDTLTPARLVLDSKSDMSRRERNIDEPSLDKENIEPILNPQGRIDLASWGNSPFLSRSSDRGCTPRLTFDAPPNMTFGYDGNGDQRGYRANPLFVPSSKIDSFDKDAYEYRVSSARTGWAATSRAGSSEATVAEEDHQELARLYLQNTTD